MDHASSPRQDRLAYLAAQAPLPALAAVAVLVAVSVTRWSVRRKTRKALAKLEPHRLEDVGLTRQQAWDEANRPFWAR